MNTHTVLSDALLDFECGNISEPRLIRTFRSYDYDLATPVPSYGFVQAVNAYGEIELFELSNAAYASLKEMGL